jgi:inhibitor of KinA sporulation pathway (predicted exonuclease)
MKYIFLDLEMNPVNREFKEVRKCCSREIIEIGAVMLDEKLNIVSEFREYVKPAYNAEVVRRVRNLTGITTEMLEDAAPFCQVFGRFVRWCGNEEYQIYSWSDNDIYQMMDELQLKYLQDRPEISYMLNHWQDFQEEFSHLLCLGSIVSLSRAVDMAGLDFAGKAHGALPDAVNTAKLYKASRDSEQFRCIRRIWKEAMTPHAFTFGDMFNFTELKLA